MAHRKDHGVPFRTGKYIVRRVYKDGPYTSGSNETVYDNHNEAYYEYIEAQEKYPGDAIVLIPHAGIIPYWLHDTRWKKEEIIWTAAAGVSILPPSSSPYHHPSAGWIYAACEIDAMPLVKIGTTRGIPQRMESLMWDNHSPILLLAAAYVTTHNAYDVESDVHRRLASSRIEGEWFYLHMNQERLAALVAEVLAVLPIRPWITPEVSGNTPAKKRKTQPKRGKYSNRYLLRGTRPNAWKGAYGACARPLATPHS